MTEINSDDSETIPNKRTSRSTTFPTEYATTITYSSAIRPRTTTTNTSTYFKERPVTLRHYGFSPKATTTGTAIYSSAIRPGTSTGNATTTTDTRKYFEEQAKYLEEKSIADKMEKEIEELEDRFWIARCKLQYPLDMPLERRIEYYDFAFFQLKKQNSNKVCPAKVNDNFKWLLERVEKLEDLVAYYVPRYSEDLHTKAIVKELEALEDRFLLAQNALNDQKSKPMKLKNDEEFIENCFRIIKDGFEESDLEDIWKYVKEFEEDVVENNNASEVDDDSIELSYSEDPCDSDDYALFD